MATEVNSNSAQSTELFVTAHTVSELLRDRHSTRAFLKTPVPQSTIEDCFALAQHSPSNSNLQPWRAYVLEDTALERVKTALGKAYDDKLPQAIAPIPAAYKHYRSDMGHLLYAEGYGITRQDKEGKSQAERRNYDFFGAPMGMVICIDSTLAPIDVLTVGIWLQSFCMLIEERELETCIVVSVAGFPDVIRKEIGIPENMTILTGLAVGFEDKDMQVNKIKTARDDWRNDVVFLKE